MEVEDVETWAPLAADDVVPGPSDEVDERDVVGVTEMDVVAGKGAEECDVEELGRSGGGLVVEVGVGVDETAGGAEVEVVEVVGGGADVEVVEVVEGGGGGRLLLEVCGAGVDEAVLETDVGGLELEMVIVVLLESLALLFASARIAGPNARLAAPSRATTCIAFWSTMASLSESGMVWRTHTMSAMAAQNTRIRHAIKGHRSGVGR